MASGSATAVVPVFKPDLTQLSHLLQTLGRAALVQRVLVVDSSCDDSAAIRSVCCDNDADWVELPFPFDHGGARNFGAAEALGHGSEVVVYVTQDCQPIDGSAVDQLIAPLLPSDTAVAATTGRQMPRPSAPLLEQSSRAVMYPSSDAERRRLGLWGTSNSFAAYSLDALLQVEGFPAPCVFGEDAMVSARLRSAGRDVRYVPKALAIHSHNYSLGDEFRRFFDAGQAAAEYSTETRHVENSNRIAILQAEMRYVWRASKPGILCWVLAVVAKAAGYQVGKLGRRVPDRLLLLLSASPHVLKSVRQSERSFALNRSRGSAR